MPDKIPDRSTLNEEDFKAMMERIEASNAGQEKYAKKQYRMSQITALCSILVLIIVIYAAVTLIPKANTTFQNLNLIMEDLDTITSDLAEADLGGMISDIDHLVSSSEDSVQNSLNQLNSIDIDTLNQAINHLNDTVTPFANFFNKFR